jgi:hypothetical protein
MCVSTICDGSPFTTYVEYVAPSGSTIRLTNNQAGDVFGRWVPWKPLGNTEPIVLDVTLVPSSVTHPCPTCRCAK